MNFGSFGTFGTFGAPSPMGSCCAQSGYAGYVMGGAYGQMQQVQMQAPPAAYGHFGGPYGKTSAAGHCAAAKAAKRAGKGTYKLRNVDVQIGKWCAQKEQEEQLIADVTGASVVDPALAYAPSADGSLMLPMSTPVEADYSAYLPAVGLGALGLLAVGAILFWPKD